MNDIVTRQNYVEEYCKAFNLKPCEDQGLAKIVYSKARPCPICGSIPALYCDMRDVDKKGFGRKIKYMIAGVIMCGCGKSSMYYDERRHTAGGAEIGERGAEAVRAVNSLADTWNGARPV